MFQAVPKTHHKEHILNSIQTKQNKNHKKRPDFQTKYVPFYSSLRISFPSEKPNHKRGKKKKKDVSTILSTIFQRMVFHAFSNIY